MSSNIYVGNLSWETSEFDVQNLFDEFGKVNSVKIILDRETSRSKGFGFVEMSDSEEASKAISALNGKEVLGRNLKVNISESNPNRR
jgi:RNA recognition motif-containing protein